MNALAHRTSTTPASWPRLGWLAVLVTGLVLFGAVGAVTLDTGDPIFLPCLLLLGAAIVPVTLTTFVTAVAHTHLSLPNILTAAVLGGVLGGILAGTLEFDAARTLGWLPFAIVALIEECAKLAVPAVFLAWLAWRHTRPRAVDGLVLGVAVGSAFAAVETMGYAFTVLLRTGGNLQPVDHLLALRGLGSLGGHAAWTGLACAALFAVPDARRRGLASLRFLAVLVAAICLHAGWDSAAAIGHGDLAIGLLSFTALMALTWWLHRAARRSAESPKAANRPPTGWIRPGAAPGGPPSTSGTLAGAPVTSAGP
ncbi:PrsW family intramembrane metalloprotease [Georgenia yuyongxinii]|uniref:PrsW family intramembrane metalloprotease n=1 Tax=Georgenia yuyongxinii TaxID=2589797 RepID=A0A5B8BZZ2_9MICO|nr:PrsW family glutamic-type intramembrane protease [Georgenia yuyongxinii]QDC23798.1 PrsW family intramembrane metalloprotease [Georgenia yuyongxinii]